MNLTKIRTAPDATPENAAGEWPVSSLVQDAAPVPAYQQEFFLRLETGGAAEQVSVDDTAELNAMFQPKDIALELDETLSSDEADFRPNPPYDTSLVAHLIKRDDDLVQVTLEAPSRIVKVEVTNGLVQSVEFYRLDGDVPAENPTVTANVNLGAAAISNDEDFTDARFALGFKDSHDGFATLNLNQIAKVWLRSYPTAPRIILSGTDGESPAETIWISPGQVTEQSPAPGNVDSGGALAKGLQRHLDTLSVPLPAQVDVRLAVQSDAPCVFKFTESGPALDVTYHLATRSLTSGADKETLRFPGGQVAAREVSVSLPGNATVVSAGISIAESFRPDRQHSNGVAALTVAALTQKRGIYVGVEKWVGQKISPQSGVEASGVAIGTMPLASSTEMLIELQEDWEGRPSGKRLAAGTISLQGAGAPGWTTLHFSSPVVLASRSYWLLAKATQGQAVWLADSARDRAQVLERSGEPAVWKQVNLVEDLELLHQLYTRSAAAQEQKPFVFTVGQTELSPDANGDQSNGRPGATHYDLTSALNSFLGDYSGPDLVTIPLTFKSTIQGFLTVYPPDIVYDVPGEVS